MLRNALAVSLGVLLGAFVVYFAEAAAQFVIRPGPSDSAPAALRLAVVFGWGSGVFVGALAGLFLARRWAPVGWVIAATLFAMAGLSVIEAAQPFWMAAAALAAALGGGFAAIRTAKAGYAPPAPPPRLPF